MEIRQTVRTVFLSLALVMLGIALVNSARMVLFLGRSERAVGRVVDYQTVEGAAPPFMGADGAGRMYYAVVEFEAPERRRFVSPVGRRTRVYSIGSEVVVRYLPDRSPDRSGGERIESLPDIWGGTLIFAGLGLLFLAIALTAPKGFRR